jgi:hypothetical protein
MAKGKYLLAGPDWKGEVPKGITKLIRADTQFVFVGYRTQLFDPEDMVNVKKVQAGYTVQPLSQFLGTPPPPAAPKVDFPPFSREKAESADFFGYLNFILQFCPTVPGDKTARELREDRYQAGQAVRSCRVLTRGSPSERRGHGGGYEGHRRQSGHRDRHSAAVRHA